MRYSLRSLNQYLPWVRKVWILGDRPAFLTDDTRLVEHVPHEALAWIAGFKTPVTNGFLLMYLAALLPELEFEFLWFCDDYILLEYLPQELARKDRCVQDLNKVTERGKGLWKESLWPTFDVLKRLGYPGFNYEIHVPIYLTKRRVLDAYRALRDFTSEDRLFGLLAQSAVLNYAQKHEGMQPLILADEGRNVGFHHKPAESYEAIVEQCRGKTFLNFDDDALDDNLRRYLAERFPTPSIYEKPGV